MVRTSTILKIVVMLLGGIYIPWHTPQNYPLSAECIKNTQVYSLRQDESPVRITTHEKASTFQIPSTKFQTMTKIPMSYISNVFVIRSFEFVWNFGFGVWNFLSQVLRNGRIMFIERFAENCLAIRRREIVKI